MIFTACYPRCNLSLGEGTKGTQPILWRGVENESREISQGSLFLDTLLGVLAWTNSASSQLLQQVLGLIGQHNMQLEVLIAGTDDSGAHLFTVSHPGVLAPADTIGFTAIGSGGLHAAIRLALGQHSKAASFADALFSVYQAKKAGEVAPGVGKLTDMAFVKDGHIHYADPQLFAMLADETIICSLLPLSILAQPG